MAKPLRTVLFLHDDSSPLPDAAVAALALSANRLGLPLHTAVATFPSELLASAYRVVAINQPTFGEPLSNVERWDVTAESLPARVNQFIATLLGGGQTSASLPPSPLNSGGEKTPPKKIHTVRVSRETAGRRGKGVTVISDLPLTLDQIDALATTLKSKCGTGGTAKDGRIEIQGDHRDRLVIELEKLGYKAKRSGG